MFVVTRKPGGKIHVGPDVTITVVEIKGNKVRLGIDAPKEVPVVMDPDLSRIIEVWPSLPTATRRAMLASIDQ
jgi:carbon storage regulator